MKYLRYILLKLRGRRIRVGGKTITLVKIEKNGMQIRGWV
jgi:hypothetical protein